MANLVGFEARGRHGVLGVIVDVSVSDEGAGSEIRIRGGVTKGLLYVIPAVRVFSVALPQKTVVLDVDVGDFAPVLQPDGTVELRVAPR